MTTFCNRATAVSGYFSCSFFTDGWSRYTATMGPMRCSTGSLGVVAVTAVDSSRTATGTTPFSLFVERQENENHMLWEDGVEAGSGGGEEAGGGKRGGGGTLLLLALVICALTKHHFRDRAPFLLLIEPPPAFGC